MRHDIRIKRVYEPAARGDGYRVLVDRLWPRGIRKGSFDLDHWAKELAPSHELRKDFGHQAENWSEFKARYRAELRSPEARNELENLARKARTRNITLLYAAKDEERNNAVVLREVLSQAARRGAPPARRSGQATRRGRHAARRSGGRSVDLAS